MKFTSFHLLDCAVNILPNGIFLLCSTAQGGENESHHQVNREEPVRVSLATWAVDVNQTNVLGKGRRKFVTRFNIRNSFMWVVTGEQLQVAESQPKS